MRRHRLMRAQSIRFGGGRLRPTVDDIQGRRVDAKKAGNNVPGNANCVGQNVSPELHWSGAPEGTKSFALTMVDPEGRSGLGVHHWVAYGIPAETTSFTESEASQL